jgi:hypothetical protein
MGRLLFAVCTAGLLQACGTVGGSVAGDPSREMIGVAAHQPNQGDNEDDTVIPPSTPAADRKLDWQQAQLCSLGVERVGEAVEPGEAGQQLVNRPLRCSPYQLSIFGVPLSIPYTGIIPPLYDFGPL